MYYVNFEHAHVTLLQSVVCLLATHVQAVGGRGGHPLQWGQLPPDQAIDGVLLYHDQTHTHTHPSDYFLRIKKPRHHTPERNARERLTSGISSVTGRKLCSRPRESTRILDVSN